MPPNLACQKGVLCRVFAPPVLKKDGATDRDIIGLSAMSAQCQYVTSCDSDKLVQTGSNIAQGLEATFDPYLWFCIPLFVKPCTNIRWVRAQGTSNWKNQTGSGSDAP